MYSIFIGYNTEICTMTKYILELLELLKSSAAGRKKGGAHSRVGAHSRKYGI